MKISITKKEDMPLLKRTQVEAKITYEGTTPSRKDVQAAVAKGLGGKKDQVVITKIATRYGDQSAVVNGYYYSDRKVLETLEQKAMIKKNTFEEEKPAAEEKAESGEPESKDEKVEGDA